MLLKLENIGKIYNSNDILTIGIRGVDLELDYNEFVTIEGESGSGKSTLLNVIGANDTYEEGELYIDGSETSHYSDGEWERYRERNIATVFQDFNIIENLTVVENVELALLRIDDRKERRRMARELIERVGLTQQANQRGSRLSGGEKQRTVIARALAKDAPIILADEPTGNLDVKSSREIAALLKEVSKDKLVIVVTHNPEFFKEYATRRVWIYDGKIAEDRVIERPAPAPKPEIAEPRQSKWRNFRNTMHIGILNYKSRPKFTSMMSFALFVCAITLFVVLSVFGQTLIKPLTATLDGVGVEGKVIVSGAAGQIGQSDLDLIQSQTGAGYALIDRELSEFTVTIPKRSGTLQSYIVTCVYAPYRYLLEGDEAVLVLPLSAARDGEAIGNVFLNAGAGIHTVRTEKSLTATSVTLYLGYDALAQNGVKLSAVNSTMKFGDYETTVYTFERSETLEEGSVALVNSNYYDIKGKTVVFGVKSNKAYVVADDSEKREELSGMVVQMSAADYDALFGESVTEASQACLYFPNDKAAATAVASLPEGYMGLLSTSRVYVQNAGDVYAMNVADYLALIVISLCFGMLISMIFMRSVKIYQTDFAVYRTLGISRKISARSLYIQMALIFLPTLALLPVVSLIATAAAAVPFISVGNYFFIEAMMLLIVELVAFGFNRSISGQSIRKSLRRGSK